MTFIRRALAAGIGSLVVFSAWARPAKDAPLAIIYAGSGSCAECYRAAAAIARNAGMRVQYVKPADIKATLFTDAALWIQPGGDAIRVVKALTPEKLELIRAFVQGGGSYLGFCAGGFFADRWVDDDNSMAGLGIIPTETFDYRKTHESRIEPVAWGSEVRTMYFQDGPGFKEVTTLSNNRNTKVLARYSSDGTPAAVMTRYGRGLVAVTGPHPEAPPEWFKVEKLVRSDGHESDADIALALLQTVLGQGTRNLPVTGAPSAANE